MASNRDNRRYDYRYEGFSVRPEYRVIADWIPEGAKVLDLASGDGALMHYLLGQKGVEVEGIERATSGVEKARSHGLSARIGDIDVAETYASIADDSFDYAVCNVTLQMVMFPEVLVGEMQRIARHQIISFPNFGHLFNRLDLLSTGRMPRPQMFGYSWYDTGQIHQLGLADFKSLCAKSGLRIVAERHQGRPEILSTLLPTLFSRTGIYLCEKAR